jgi:hypothetical protein
MSFVAPLQRFRKFFQIVRRPEQARQDRLRRREVRVGAIRFARRAVRRLDVGLAVLQ